MTGRILVVDDIPANVRLLEAKLVAEYYDVLTASSGREAIGLANGEQPDLILLDVMMPEMDGYETCRRLKADPATSHIPVVMVTALDQQSARIEGLEAGADDFLTKPPNDLALFARVKSLLRVKMMMDELRMRQATTMELGVAQPMGPTVWGGDLGGRVLIVEDRAHSSDRIIEALGESCECIVSSDGLEALARSRAEPFDLMIVSLSLANFDGLRLCSQVRSAEQTRQLPLLILVEDGDPARLARGLDLGANDYLLRPVDRNELLARARTQFLRKKYADELRRSLDQSVELSVKDALTGLYNRRYLSGHLETLSRRSREDDRPMALLILDIDHFKAINDTYGHQIGDEVLKDFAQRLLANVRGVDLAARFGGEEFVVVMPETQIDAAYVVAERLREEIAGRAFKVSAPIGEIEITTSIGVAKLEGADDTVDAMIARADEALYRAKREGRNRVVREAA